ncbi:hypothetical protein [Nostoc sp. PA-18-2419]|uniref:hypothetical protein n=1 Tax=Nostoc sp. PA-18-2419 TaxID=2575443 RepID=UPI001109BBCD|nr:hypothetical protein [Nostoc sp. PA-18-2419]
MNESIEPNVTTNSEQSYLQEENTESNESQTIDTELNDPQNSLVQKGKPVLLADGTINPPPPKPEIISERIA